MIEPKSLIPLLKEAYDLANHKDGDLMREDREIIADAIDSAIILIRLLAQEVRRKDVK